MDTKSAARYILPNFKTPFGGVYPRGASWRVLDDGNVLAVVSRNWSPAMLAILLVPLVGVVVGLTIWLVGAYIDLPLPRTLILRFVVQLMLPFAGVALIFIAGANMNQRRRNSSQRRRYGSRSFILVNRAEQTVLLPDAVPPVTRPIRFSEIAAFQLLEGDFASPVAYQMTVTSRSVAELNIILAGNPPIRLNIMCSMSGAALRQVADAVAAAAHAPLHVFIRRNFVTTEHMLEPFDISSALKIRRERAPRG